jgi:hypothetical protein
MNSKYLLSRFVLLLCIAGASGCVVAPKKVAAYDPKCKVATQKITLGIQSTGDDGVASCTQEDCLLSIPEQISRALFTTATSAIVSGSIAVAGNTKYLLESGGECPNSLPENLHQLDETQTPDEYTIVEEIVAAKF